MGASAEPRIKSYYAQASRDALREIWGPRGVEDVAGRMAPAHRDELFAPRLPVWFPERVLIAFNFALWEGPVARRRDTYERWLWRTTDLSFGVVRRLVLSLASPRRIFESAPELWRADHTHGTLQGRCDDDRTGTFVLRDSPFVETPQGRAAISESFRYIVQLGGARGAVEKHALTAPGVLEVRLRWAGSPGRATTDGKRSET